MTVQDYLLPYYPNLWHQINFPTTAHTNQDLTEIEQTINALQLAVNINQPNRYGSGIFPLTKVNNNLYNITPGILYFFDKRDRENPLFLKVEVSGSISLSNLFSEPNTPEQGIFWCYVHRDGSLGALVNRPSSDELEDKIFFARMRHSNNQVVSIEPLIIENDNLTKKLLDEGGSRNISLKIIPARLALSRTRSRTNFQLQLSGGKVQILGENWSVDPLNPHTIDVAAISNAATLIWDEYTPEGTLIQANINSLNFGRYFDKPSNRVVTFNGNGASVKFFYYDDHNKKFIAIMGCNRYESLDLASQRAAVFDIPPRFDDKVLVAIVIGVANGSDSNDLQSLRILNQGGARGETLYFSSSSPPPASSR